MNMKMIGIMTVGFILLIVVMMLNPITIIGAGERGVVFNRATGIEDRVLGEGFHFRTPIIESVIKMPIKTQISVFDEKGSDSAGTQDSQRVDVKVTINWHLDPSTVNKVYQEVGSNDDVVAKVLTNNTQDAIKQAISKYQALDVQKNRDVVAESALSLLQTKVKRYHVIVENLSITNLDFSNEFNAAIEQAQVAQQNAKKAEYTVQQVKAEAQAAIAKAEGEAAAQKAVQQTLTPELLEKLWIERWNGVLPTYSSSNLPMPVINFSK